MANSKDFIFTRKVNMVEVLRKNTSTDRVFKYPVSEEVPDKKAIKDAKNFVDNLKGDLRI